MSYTPIREPANFGKRASVNTITVTSNGKTRHFNFNPVAMSVIACFVFTFLMGYFIATAYLMFRDDLIGASYAREARLKHEYEDRIAALRSKLDRVTSRQLLDQQAIETRVRQLMERQEILGSQNGAMARLLEKAEARGLAASSPKTAIPVPSTNPTKQQQNVDKTVTGSINTFSPHNKSQMASAFSLRGTQTGKPGNQKSDQEFGVNFGSNEFTNRLFGDVAQAISIIDDNQRKKVQALRVAANDRSAKITKALKSIGVSLKDKGGSGVGGPYVPLDKSSNFDSYMEALEDSLEQYDAVSEIARSLPLAQPVRNARVSSRFGSRVDPFNGRVAMHNGIDYKAPTGTPVYATGAGRVVKAGRSGGYGKMVEIRHKNGLVTRYAHLSRISVKVGHKVETGQRIGKVGSTGRSTGPHLHYEVRKGKNARNPAKYLKAGMQIRGLL